MSSRIRTFAAIALAWQFLDPNTAFADVGAASDALPDTVTAYVEILDVPTVLATVLDHPLRQEVERLPGVLEAKKQPGYQGAQAALTFLEYKLGEQWRPAIEKLTKHGLHLAWDAETAGVVVLAQSDDATFLVNARDVLLEMIGNDARDHKRPDPISAVEYRGVTMHVIGDARAAVVGGWLVVANKEQLGQRVVDRLLDEGEGSLSSKESFAAARVDSRHSAWAWADLAAWRQAGAAEDLFRGRAKDLGGELIFGGVLAALSESPYAGISLDVNADGLSLSATLPRDAAGQSEPRDYFFGAANQGAAPRAIAVEHSVGTIRAYRDVAALWRQSPDIFNEQVNAGLAKAESDLSTLFGGKSFSDEILPSLGQQVQLVFAWQDFSTEVGPVPAIKLPAGAAIFRLAEPEQSQRPLRIAFQSLIGFVNLSAPQEGRSPLEITTEKLDGATLVSTAYDAHDVPDKGAAGVQFNFSPTIAFVDDWFILASTRTLAVDVADQLTGEQKSSALATAPSDDRIINTAIDVSMPVVKRILTENHEHLIAQNMLEKGHERADAEQEIATLETIVGWLDAADLELTVGDDDLRLTLSVELAD